jgi:hypothetical protein
VKRAIVILCILIFIITFGSLEIVWVSKILTTMENSINDICHQYELNENEITQFYTTIGDIKEYWMKKEEYLSYLFNHRDLSIITDSFNRLQAYTKNNDYDNAIAELELLKYYSSKNCHIMGFDINNIF